MTEGLHDDIVSVYKDGRKWVCFIEKALFAGKECFYIYSGSWSKRRIQEITYDLQEAHNICVKLSVLYDTRKAREAKERRGDNDYV